MSRLELISYFDENVEKCKTCMFTKITRSSFSNVQRITKLLELIHSDLGDFHSTPFLKERNTMSLSLMILQGIVKCIFPILEVKH